MALIKLAIKSGVNRENTRYTNENGWYESDKIRFRQGTPEVIGGWRRISGETFLGVCRSLWNWVTLNAQNLLGVGTSLKFYIENGGAYYDITPVRTARTLTNPFTTNGTTTVVVNDASGGFLNNDYVTLYGGTAVGGQLIRGEFQIRFISSAAYSITIPAAATAATGGGTVYAVYQTNTGPTYAVPLSGWGAGPWGVGVWGTGATSTDALRLWNQMNWGENLVYGPRGGALYYWIAAQGYKDTEVALSIGAPCVLTTSLPLQDKSPITLTTTGSLPTGLTPGTTYYTKYLTPTTSNLSLTPGGAAITTTGTQSGTQAISARGVLLSTLPNSDGYAPLMHTTFAISDVSRFLLVFGTNDIGSTVYDPMLIRWSDQESLTTWYPAITNQAGSVRLSHGSKIVTTLQSRQELLVWTDQAMYALQYQGPPYIWSTQLMVDNISIAGPNAAAMASGVTYWMGIDKFYKYDGRTQTLRCDLRQWVYDDINLIQADQIFASTNEGFTEVWFFYCSSASTTVDRYVIYNYTEDVWYYGTMGRTAWLDTGLRNYPVAATYSNNLVSHELGVDDGEGPTLQPIAATITSSQFDLGDGDSLAFVWRILPDLTFRGSTDGTTPELTLQLLPLINSGSGYNIPKSVGGITNDAAQPVAATQTYPIDLDTYNGQVYIRVRARQMSLRITSNKLGTHWQLGSPRIDVRSDGKRGAP